MSILNGASVNQLLALISGPRGARIVRSLSSRRFMADDLSRQVLETGCFRASKSRWPATCRLRPARLLSRDRGPCSDQLRAPAPVRATPQRPPQARDWSNVARAARCLAPQPPARCREWEQDCPPCPTTAAPRARPPTHGLPLRRRSAWDL